MSVKPINIMMAITQSQNLKPPDSDHNIKHAAQADQINAQNIKNKESVAKIPDDENHTEIMDTIKHGMTDNNGDFHSDHHHNNKNDAEDVVEKGMLDDDNGHSLDIMG